MAAIRPDTRIPTKTEDPEDVEAGALVSCKAKEIWFWLKTKQITCRSPITTQKIYFVQDQLVIFFLKHFNIFIRLLIKKFVVSIIVFCFILPCKRPVFSHLVFDLLTVEDLIHRGQCCCRNTKYFITSVLICFAATQKGKNVHVRVHRCI